MDRNSGLRVNIPAVDVALRKESVDRNLCDISLNYKEVVALRKESVDRNVRLLMCF